MKPNIYLAFFTLAVAFTMTVNLAHTQVFKNIELDATNFTPIDKELSLSFPRDHGSHDQFQLEWWYLTANLKDETGATRGLQWTLFRFALENDKNKPNWNNSHIWMGHAAVTARETHFFHEKFARGGVQQAGVSLKPFNAWIDNWRLTGDTWEKLNVSADSDEFKYNINIESFGPIIKHGDSGFSVKSSDGHASAYYSQPFFSASGWIETNGQRKKVTGTAWFDHEWSNQFLSKKLKGWHWFSLNFKSGDKLMLFRVEEAKERYYYSGTWIYADGRHIKINPEDISLQPNQAPSSAKVPKTDWRIKIDSFGVDLTIKPLNKNSFMNTLFPYWEGPIKSSGSHKGNGYLEITGF